VGEKSLKLKSKNVLAQIEKRSKRYVEVCGGRGGGGGGRGVGGGTIAFGGRSYRGSSIVLAVCSGDPRSKITGGKAGGEENVTFNMKPMQTRSGNIASAK